MENFSLNSDSQINSSSEIDNLEKPQKKIAEVYNVSLLEEKLVVKRQKYQVGEVVIRKEIETRTLHIPIRREKLIVEKVGITTEHIAEVNLGEEKVNGIKFGDFADSDNIYQSQSSFMTPEALQGLLNKIKNRPDGENIKLRLEIFTDNSKSQKACQDICDEL